MRIFAFAFHMSKAVLFAIMQAVFAVVAAFCRLLGIRPPAVPQPLPVPSTTPEDVADEYRDEYTREVANDHALASDVGMAVHRYASQNDPAIRGAVDLGGLTETQMDWLLSLQDSDLERLAKAGPKACELAISGKRCGVVGLPALPAQESGIEGPVAVRDPIREMLVERIRSARAVRLAA